MRVGGPFLLLEYLELIVPDAGSGWKTGNLLEWSNWYFVCLGAYNISIKGTKECETSMRYDNTAEIRNYLIWNTTNSVETSPTTQATFNLMPA